MVVLSNFIEVFRISGPITIPIRWSSIALKNFKVLAHEAAILLTAVANLVQCSHAKVVFARYGKRTGNEGQVLVFI